MQMTEGQKGETGVLVGPALQFKGELVDPASPGVLFTQQVIFLSH